MLNGHALDSHLGELVPLVCALLQSASGPTKLAAERTLARLLRVSLATHLLVFPNINFAQVTLCACGAVVAPYYCLHSCVLDKEQLHCTLRLNKSAYL